MSRIEEYKRKHLSLGHRVLKVIVQQEIHRKMGYGILAEEEQLRIKLEAIQQELNAPTQFKVCNYYLSLVTIWSYQCLSS